jgi:hypothetical protein
MRVRTQVGKGSKATTAATGYAARRGLSQCSPASQQSGSFLLLRRPLQVRCHPNSPTSLHSPQGDGFSVRQTHPCPGTELNPVIDDELCCLPRSKRDATIQLTGIEFDWNCK